MSGIVIFSAMFSSGSSLRLLVVFFPQEKQRLAASHQFLDLCTSTEVFSASGVFCLALFFSDRSFSQLSLLLTVNVDHISLPFWVWKRCLIGNLSPD